MYTVDCMANLTVYLPEQLDKLMRSYPEVNWGELCRIGIKEYLRMRRTPSEIFNSTIQPPSLVQSTTTVGPSPIQITKLSEIATKSRYLDVEQIIEKLQDETSKRGYKLLRKSFGRQTFSLVGPNKAHGTIAVGGIYATLEARWIGIDGKKVEFMEDASRRGESAFVVYHEKPAAATFVIPFDKIPKRYWPDRKGYSFNIDKVGGKFIIRQNGVDLTPYLEKYALLFQEKK